jgi:hypothetical protein
MKTQGERNATYHLPRAQIVPSPRTGIGRAAIETSPAHPIAQLRRRVARMHHLNHAPTPNTSAAGPARGRGHRRTEDGAGERVEYVPAMRDGERLRRVLRERVVVVPVGVLLCVCERRRRAHVATFAPAGRGGDG